MEKLLEIYGYKKGKERKRISMEKKERRRGREKVKGGKYNAPRGYSLEIPRDFYSRRRLEASLSYSRANI